jgi:AraC-like DNA-binding protein
MSDYAELTSRRVLGNTGAISASEQGSSVTIFQFSTDDLPERDRFAVYRDEVVRKAFHWDVHGRDHADCRFAVSVRGFGAVQNATCDATPVIFSRGRKELEDGPDGYMLVINRMGRYHVSQSDRTAALGSGSAALLDNSRAASVEIPETGRCWSLFVDRAALTPRIARPDEVLARKIEAENPALRLLVDYIASAENLSPISDPATERIVGAHIIDLIAAAVCTGEQGPEMLTNGSVRTARAAALRMEIARNASDPRLSSIAVAQRFGMSDRYLRRILEENGQTFSGLLLESRLQLARRTLLDPAHAFTKISEIAFGAGFSDISYFNRTFHRRFGDTPSGARRKHQR